MGLLMQLLLIAISWALIHGSAEPSSRPPLPSSQRYASAPVAPTFPRSTPFSETRGPAQSPHDIAAPPSLTFPMPSPPMPPVPPPKEKKHRNAPNNAPISPPNKMKPRIYPSTPAVTPTSPAIMWSPSRSPIAHHPIVSRPPYPSPIKNGGTSISVPQTSASSSHKWHSREPAPAPVQSIPKQVRPRNWNYSPSSSPKRSVQKHHDTRSKIHSETPAPSFTLLPRALKPGTASPPSQPPKIHPKRKSRHIYVPSSSQENDTVHVPLPAPIHAPNHFCTAVPAVSPYISLPNATPKRPSISPPLPSFPPPPPNKDCTAFECTVPFTNTPPGSPCGCVWPMQVGLRLDVALYTFFPLVTKLAEKVAAGLFVKQSQVRIMGANVATQQPEKTILLIDLVPLGERFDSVTAYLIYSRFWHKKVALGNKFGDYDVLYIRYPGLPPSPPTAPSDTADNNGIQSGNSNNGIINKPFGVDVHESSHGHHFSSSAIAIIALSASLAVVLCTATAWLLMFRCRHYNGQSILPPQVLLPSPVKQSGITNDMVGSKPGSGSVSFASSIAAFLGSAKTISFAELQRATNNFDVSKIVGEGGFGCVYSGVLEDGTHVAVKVLKRDDHHGDREFMAEVEILSRLHHRNLVKLIGICIEAQSRCLIYELVPNGSVQSHLHGQDKERSPIDWVTRLKIALGAARGLAYLHEDSSPRVIHRDFKSSNILLEHDFTPKVSDFGLARTGMEEENGYISTRVMGTFGYVAPEYAMTGHLLVKSDVYSYGVVLLELLTGRKPVDMSQPPGEENLVSWARPLLTSREGLELMLDKGLGPGISYDTVAKVAAIASLCVQPEVSQRPSIGEVVQALKLVCNECEDAEVAERSGTCSPKDLPCDVNAGIGTSSSHFLIPCSNITQPVNRNYISDTDCERGLSVSEPLTVSPSFMRGFPGSLRRYSSSGPLTTGRGRQFWRRIRRVSRDTVS
uniref:Protein kinase domain-containing protein n=1 Tax=Kalanchoe fedtschenkoi TaxID=63787 RepID=A0A7N0TUD2_KALFE